MWAYSCYNIQKASLKLLIFNIGYFRCLDLGLATYISKRMLLIIFVVFGLLTVVFIVARVIPIDPVHSWAGERVHYPGQLEKIRQKYHLDEPLWRQYIYYFEDLLRGDLGVSPATHRPIAWDLTKYFPATLELALISLVIVMGLGIPLGVISALKRETKIDYLLRSFSLLGTSMPTFWLGVILQFVFYYSLGWLPMGGRIGVEWTRITGFILFDTLVTGNLNGFLDAVRHMILPAFVLSFTAIGLIIRITRSSMLEVIGADYIRTARSKGLPERVVNYKHALKNALIPPLTALAYTFVFLLQGAVIVEVIFSWPGLGTYSVGSILQLDFPAIMGVTLIAGISSVIVNLITDILYTRIDPRIEYSA